TLERLGLAQHAVREQAETWHTVTEFLAYGVGTVALVYALLLYYYRVLNPEEARQQFPGLHRFLWNKWYFDELYSAVLVRPAVRVALWCKAFDTHVIDSCVDGLARFIVRVSKWDGRFDLGVVDGLVNLIARVCYVVGGRLRNVQTGYLRS